MLFVFTIFRVCIITVIFLTFIHCRTRLKLFHPSQEECKPRCCDNDDAITANGNASGDEDNEKNNREFNRSDSLVIHDVPENNKSSSVNDERKSPTETSEPSSSNTIQSLLKSIRTETFNIQSFLVTPDGKITLKKHTQ